MESYCVIYRKDFREIGRSKGMPFEKALAKVRKLNVKYKGRDDFDLERRGNCSYVEATHTVKHLPVMEERP